MKQNHLIVALAALIALGGATLLTGCNQSQSLFRRPSNMAPGHAAAAAPDPAAPAPTAVAPARPYVLSAHSAGSFIEFSIYNMSDQELPVRREDFAVISTDSRNVTPYTADGTIIDLPQPAVVAPNSTLKGRAIFKSITNPRGHRLVFKPDDVGTFADINPQ